MITIAKFDTTARSTRPIEYEGLKYMNKNSKLNLQFSNVDIGCTYFEVQAFILYLNIPEK